MRVRRATCIHGLVVGLVAVLGTATREMDIDLFAIVEIADIGAKHEARRLQPAARPRFARGARLDGVGFRDAIDQPRRHSPLIVRVVGFAELPFHAVVGSNS